MQDLNQFSLSKLLELALAFKAVSDHRKTEKLISLRVGEAWLEFKPEEARHFLRLSVRGYLRAKKSEEEA